MSDRNAQGQFRQGNTINRRHGADGFRSLSRMPKGCRSVRGDLNRFRSALESETRRALGIQDGPIPPRYMASINAAVGHEGTRRLWLRWVNRKGDDADGATFARAMAEVGRCGEMRDRIVDRLLSAEPPSPFASIFASSGFASELRSADEPPYIAPPDDVAPESTGELANGWGSGESDR